MHRRLFTTLTAAALAWPALLRGQSNKPARIGVLVVSNPEPFLGLLKEGLRRLGYAEGRNLRIELRSAQGRAELLKVHAAELVRLKVDVLVAWQTPAVQAAKEATAELPIVMMAGDPVGTGLVASLARPGGNITGMSSTTAAIGGKTLELIREILPGARRVAVLANAADPFMKPFLDQLEQGARTLAMDIHPLRVRAVTEFDDAFSQMSRSRADAVIVQPSLPRDAAIRLALKHRLPSVCATRAFPEAGGLLSYAARVSEIYSGTAVYVDRILKGAQPAELPVQQPTTFELVVNLSTAKALGIDVPRAVLLRADKVID